MRIRAATIIRTAALCLTWFYMLAGPALAAGEDKKLPPYDVQGIAHGQTWVPWVFAFLFTAACVALAVKNPHRSTTGGQ